MISHFFTAPKKLASPFGGSPAKREWGCICGEAAGPQLSYLTSIFENPVIVIYQKDLSTHRSCSDFYGQHRLACFHRSR